MSTEHRRLADPWNDLPGQNLYLELGPEFGPHMSRSELRDAYFELMEEGRVSDRAEQAYQTLQFVARRLVHDAGFYDASLAGELLEFLAELPCGETAAVPLHEQMRFAWDV